MMISFLVIKKNKIFMKYFILIFFFFFSLVDDFSNGYKYESHLVRFCKNVIVVSLIYPHSLFLQKVDDLTHSDNFFSKIKFVYSYFKKNSKFLFFGLLVNFIIVVLMLNVLLYLKQHYVLIYVV